MNLRAYTFLLLSALTTALLAKILLLGVYFRGYRDGDAFWHLATGRLIATSGYVPRSDPFSFTTTGADWVNINWLGQLILYWSTVVAGLSGPVFVSAVSITICVLCYGVGVRRARAVPVILAGAFLLSTLLYLTQLRPQTLSLAFFSLVVYCVYVEGPRVTLRISLALLCLIVVWNQVHGGVTFGYLFLATSGFGELLDRRSLRASKTIRNAVICLVGLSSFALHPHGYDALVHLVTYGRQIDRDFYAVVTELLPLSLASDRGLQLLAFVLLLLPALYKRTVTFSFAIPTIVFLGLALGLQRVLPFFAIVVAPYAAQYWSALYGSSKPRYEDWMQRVLIATPLVLLVWFGLWGSARTPAVSSELFPASIAAHPGVVGHRILADYTAAGYLIWLWGPKARVFLDGRGDLHSGRSTLSDYQSLVQATNDWQTLLKDYQIDSVVLRSESPLLTQLQSLGWNEVAVDAPFRALQSVTK